MRYKGVLAVRTPARLSSFFSHLGSHDGDTIELGKPRPRFRLPGLRLLLCLLLLMLFATSGNSPVSEMDRIAARGSLTMLTLNGASTYFIGPEGETGFEYELAREFADFVGLPLEVVPLPTLADLFDYPVDGEDRWAAFNALEQSVAAEGGDGPTVRLANRQHAAQEVSCS